MLRTVEFLKRINNTISCEEFNMQQNSLYQANRQQLLMVGSTIFVSVTAAVIVSTLLVMSLMRGEIASALSSNVQNSSPTTSQVASTCAVPAAEQDQAAPAEAVTYSAVPATETYSAPLAYHVPKAASVINSYNSTNVSNVTSNTTNNVTNTELHKTTVIKDSFNEDSYNDNSKDSHNPVVIKDNEVNIDSNNNTATAINSGNTVNSKTTNNTTNNVEIENKTNINSNNTFETHVLSDNNTVIVPIIPLVTPVI